MIQPYWITILSHFEKKNYFANGLTIPFLIGARKIAEPWEDKFTVDSFLRAISNSYVPLTIMRCGNINEYIIGILDVETQLSVQQRPLEYRIVGNIVCTDCSFDDIIEESELASLLIQEYDGIVKSGKYSKNDGVWDDFTDVEHKRISEAFICRL